MTNKLSTIRLQLKLLINFYFVLFAHGFWTAVVSLMKLYHQNVHGRTENKAASTCGKMKHVYEEIK